MKNKILQERLKIYLKDAEVIATDSNGYEHEVFDVVIEKGGKRIILLLLEL